MPNRRRSKTTIRSLNNLNELDTILSISNAVERFEQTERSICSTELKAWAGAPNTSLKKDFFIAELENIPVGFIGLEVRPGTQMINRIFARGSVLPEFRHLGIGNLLMQVAEIRAKELRSSFPNSLGVAFDVLCRPTQAGNNALCKARGMKEIRSFSTSVFDLTNYSQKSSVTASSLIKFRSFLIEKDSEPTRRAINEVFQFYWSFEPIDQAQWVDEFITLPYFRPELWILASHNDQVVGFSINFIDPDYLICRSKAEGYISLVGVREKWRKQGIGESLVHHSLSILKQNEMKSAYLYVDREDHQYIMAMYRKIGFQETNVSIIYRKFL